MKRTARTQEALDWMESLIARMEALAAENQQALLKIEAELAALQSRRA